MTFPHRSPRFADLAISAFISPAIEGRRVLWVGDSASQGADRAASHASALTLLDTSGEGRRRRRRHSPIVVPYDVSGIAFEPHAFDVAIVTDLSALEHPSLRVDELARIVGEDGLIIASAAAEHAEQLHLDLCRNYPDVRVFGAAQFMGITLADLMADASASQDLIVDGSLLSDSEEAVARVFAFASSILPSLDRMTIVQVPTQVGSRESAGQDPRDLEARIQRRTREAQALRDELDRAENRLRQAQQRILAVEGELSEARAKLSSAPLASAPLAAQPTPLAAIPAAPSATREAEADAEHLAEIDALEAKLQAQGRALREAQAQVEEKSLLFRDLVEELSEWQLGRRGATVASGLSMAAALELEARYAAAEHTISELQRSLQVISDARAASQPSAPQPSASAQAIAKLTDERDRARADALRLLADVGAFESRLEGLSAGYELRIRMLADDLQRVTNDAQAKQPESQRVLALEAALRAARDETASAKREAAAAQAQAAQAQATPALDTAIDTSALESLRGENAGLRMRLRDREIALTRLNTLETGELVRDQDQMREEIALLRASNAELTLRLADTEHARAETETHARDVAQLLASRDALIARLQADVAQLEREQSLTSERNTRFQSEIQRLRDALLESVGISDERDRAVREAAQLKGALAQTESRAALLQAEKGALDTAEQSQRELQAQLEQQRAHAQELEQQLRYGAQALEAAQATRERLQGERDALQARATQAEENARAMSQALADQREEMAQALTVQRDEMAQTLAAQREENAALHAQLSEEKQRLEAALSQRAQAHESYLDDTRDVLQHLRARLDQIREGVRTERPMSEITTVGMEAPDRDEEVSLEQQLADKDTLLRSLTAQLEERGDRIRALEQSIEGEPWEPSLDAAELEQRAARLSATLENERSVRMTLERELSRLRTLEGEGKSPAEHERELEELRLLIESQQQAVATLRKVCGRVRGEVEHLAQDAQVGSEMEQKLAAALELLADY